MPIYKGTKDFKFTRNPNTRESIFNSNQKSFSGVTEEYPVDARTYNKKNVDHDIEKILREKFGGRKNVKIRFGITGDSGTGKSAFINGIRG